MLQIVSCKPADGKWQCALCESPADQGKWMSNVTDSEGRATSFICEKHKHLTLEEILDKLDRRQEQTGYLTFNQSEETGEIKVNHSGGWWWSFDPVTNKFKSYL